MNIFSFNVPTMARRLATALLTAPLLTLAPMAALVSSGPALAQLSGPSIHGEIVPGWRATDGTRMAAVQLRMSPGWHTYWRIPGDAGIAPQFDWSQSQNIASIEPIWPRPTVFILSGLQSYGFEDELILPLRITPQNPNRPMVIMGDLSVGVCKDICVPADVRVQGVLRGNGEADARITAAIGRRAEPAEGFGLSRTTCRLEPGQRGASLTLRATVPQTGPDERIIMELPGSGYWISDSRTWREGGDLVAEARVRNPDRGPVGIDRSNVAFTILSDDRMVYSRGCVGG